MREILPAIYPLSGTSDTSGALDLITPQLVGGSVLHVQEISASNVTGDSTTVKVGILRSGNTSWIKTITLTTHALFYSMPEPFSIPSDAQIIFRFAGAGSTHECDALVIGLLETRWPDEIVQ